MPIRRTKDGKYSFGGVKYNSREKAERAYEAYRAKEHGKKKRRR